MHMKTTGQRFKDLRKELRLTQEVFANKIGLSKSAISAVESDKSFISQNVMSTLFMEFNVNLNWLVVGEGKMFNAPKYEDVKDEILKEVDEILKKYGVKNI